jgi:hypothetical protein
MVRTYTSWRRCDTDEKLLVTRNSIDIVWLSRKIVRSSERLSHAYENKIREYNDMVKG